MRGKGKLIMTEQNPWDGADPRLKRLRYLAHHRGTKECDLIVGGFAEEALLSLTSSEVDVFERLLDVPDNELYDWIAGRKDVPPAFDTPLFRRLKARPLVAR